MSVSENLELFADKFDELYKGNRAATIGLCLLGAAWIGKHALTVLGGIYRNFLRPGRNLYKRYQGGYVVITGATFGLGYEYAKQLIAKGFNIVLVARNQQKLDAVKTELNQINPESDVKTIKFDFDVPYTEENYASLKKDLLALKDVSIIINNVGAIAKEPLHTMPMSSINTMIQVNCIPQAFITHLMIPKLLERSEGEGKRCAIINISSVALFTRMANAAMYSATKAYGEALSEVTAKELADKNIDVMSVLPGPTRSNMTRYDAPLVIKPEQHVSYALSAVGYQYLSYGHYYHYLYTIACKFSIFNEFYRRRMDASMKRAS